MNRFRLWAITLVVAFVTMAVHACTTADATPNKLMKIDEVTVSAANDTVFISVSWTNAPTTDGRGPIDAIRVTATRNLPLPLLSRQWDIPAASNRHVFAIPTGLTVPGTTSGQVCAFGVRRTLLNTAGACANYSYTWEDSPPNGGPLQMRIDSLRPSVSSGRVSDTLIVGFAMARVDAQRIASNPDCRAGRWTSCKVYLAATFAGRPTKDVYRQVCGWLDPRSPRHAMVLQEPPPRDSATRWMDCDGAASQLGVALNTDSLFPALAAR